MQTLQCFAGSLHDRAGLQKLRENLQDLPRRWLSRHEQSEDYLLGTVTGECNYRFTFRLQGGGFFQTGVLVASAEHFSGGLPVPLRCRWRRRVGDMTVEIPGVTSNMYQISADDVGTHIYVEAQPADMDDGLRGAVVGEMGPFELDPATRRHLDNALGLGGSKFTASQAKAPGDASSPPGGRQDLAIHVSNESVRVVPLQGGTERTARETVAEYSADYPRVIIHPLDTSKFQLVMSESKTFHLVALSRTSRDLIALTIRCFHAKRYLSTSGILEALLPVRPLLPGAASLAPVDGRLDACIVLERLLKELNRSMLQKEISEKVLRNTNHEKRQLQAQLMETISGFTEVIEGLQDQFSSGAPAPHAAVPVERLQEQLREVSSQNQALQAEMQAARQQIDRLQAARKAAEAQEAPHGLADKLQQLKQERDILRARLTELSSSSSTLQQRDQVEQSHALEIKRLRQDLETLHNQKEDLRRQLQDQDRERQELQDNFLYVKGQLDKVQMRQAQAEAEGPDDGTRELQKLRKGIDGVVEERSRLAARLEGVLREAEKEKAYHEQSLERVVMANARLTEERDRTVREVERLSRLYAESVRQLRGSAADASPEDGVAPGHGATQVIDEEELRQLRAQLRDIDEQLARREQENEALKNRIRKLAVA